MLSVLSFCQRSVSRLRCVYAATVFICTATLLLPVSAPAAEMQVPAVPTRAATPMLPYLSWSLDPSGTLTVQDMASEKQESTFRPYTNLYDLPHEAGTMWLRFTLAAKKPDSKIATQLLDMGDAVPGTPTLYIPRSASARDDAQWQAFTPSQRSVFLMPEPKDTPQTVFIRLEGVPGLWFAPQIRTPHNAATSLDRLLYPALLVTLCVVMILCLLRGLSEWGEWRVWTAAFTGAALCSAVMGLPPTPNGIISLENLITVLAPGIALMLLPHVARHLLQTPTLSKILDVQYILLSLPGAALVLLPLMPGFAWITCYYDLWPLGTLLLVPTTTGAWLAGLPGARRFLLGCLFPPLGVGVALACSQSGINEPMWGIAPLLGVALGALIIAGTAAPGHPHGKENRRTRKPSDIDEDIVREDPNLRIVSLTPEDGETPLQEASPALTAQDFALEEKLRTPLDALQRDSNALMQCSLPPAVRQTCESIIENIGIMGRIITNAPDAGAQLLHASAAQNKDIIFDLQEILRLVHDSMSPLADSKNIALSWFMPPHLAQRYVGNADHIRTVLGLLLESSVRATDRGAVQLAVRRVPESVDPGHLLFAVNDSGTGTPPDGRSSLALSRAWELAGANRGFLSAESGPLGVSIAFTMRLEIAQSDAEDIPVIPESCIIIVDDSPSNRQLLAFFLEGMPFTLHEARSPAEALSIHSETPAKLFIFDADMPVDLTGALHQLRETEQARHIPPALLMALSSDDTQWDMLRQAGFTHALPKPITRKGLRTTVRQLFPEMFEESSKNRAGSPPYDGNTAEEPIIDTGAPLPPEPPLTMSPLTIDTAGNTPHANAMPDFSGLDFASAPVEDAPPAAPSAVPSAAPLPEPLSTASPVAMPEPVMTPSATHMPVAPEQQPAVNAAQQTPTPPDTMGLAMEAHAAALLTDNDIPISPPVSPASDAAPVTDEAGAQTGTAASTTADGSASVSGSDVAASNVASQNVASQNVAGPNLAGSDTVSSTAATTEAAATEAVSSEATDTDAAPHAYIPLPSIFDGMPVPPPPMPEQMCEHEAEAEAQSQERPVGNAAYLTSLLGIIPPSGTGEPAPDLTVTSAPDAHLVPGLADALAANATTTHPTAPAPTPADHSAAAVSPLAKEQPAQSENTSGEIASGEKAQSDPQTDKVPESTPAPEATPVPEAAPAQKAHDEPAAPQTEVAADVQKKEGVSTKKSPVIPEIIVEWVGNPVPITTPKKTAETPPADNDSAASQTAASQAEPASAVPNANEVATPTAPVDTNTPTQSVPKETAPEGTASGTPALSTTEADHPVSTTTAPSPSETVEPTNASTTQASSQDVSSQNTSVSQHTDPSRYADGADDSVPLEGASTASDMAGTDTTLGTVGDTAAPAGTVASGIPAESTASAFVPQPSATPGGFSAPDDVAEWVGNPMPITTPRPRSDAMSAPEAATAMGQADAHASVLTAEKLEPQSAYNDPSATALPNSGLKKVLRNIAQWVDGPHATPKNKQAPPSLVRPGAPEGFTPLSMTPGEYPEDNASAASLTDFIIPGASPTSEGARAPQATPAAARAEGAVSAVGQAVLRGLSPTHGAGTSPQPQYANVGEPSAAVPPRPTAQELPLKDLLEDFDNAAAGARRAYMREHIEGVEHAARHIATQADRFGLRTLARMARCVEDAAKAKDKEAVGNLLPDLENFVERNRIAMQGK